MKSQIGVPLEGLADLGRIAAAQGAVLLKNEDKTLPVCNQEKVSVFGRIQIDYYRSGTGSGGAVNVPYTTNLLDALRNNKRVQVNEELAKVYTDWCQENPFDNGGGGWAAEPWCQVEMPLTDGLVKAASESSDKAIIVIGRTAGEDKDNSVNPGSYLLTDIESDMIDKVTRYFSKVIIVLNVSNIIDISWIEKAEWKESIKSVIYVWQGGMEGGNAAADVLTGVVTPSGKLADTIAWKIEDYPSNANHGDTKENIYQEDIYIGYRYFETFAPQKVQYPFGFGLSYTEFTLKPQDAKVTTDGIVVEVEVENIGTEYNGREVVQIYIEAPQGKLGRPAKELVGFAKTSVLECGKKQIVTIDIPWERMATYDDSGVTGHKSCYLLEAGEYRFYAGNSVADAEPITVDGLEYYLQKDIRILHEFEEACAPKVSFERMKPGMKNEDGTYQLTYEKAPVQTIDMEKRIMDRLPQTYPITGDKGIKLQDVAAGKASMEDFVAQFTAEELAIIVRGEGMCSNKVTPGVASTFGGVTEKFLEYGIPAGACSDGPSGIRMDNGSFATQLPIGTLLACTFDMPLMQMLFYWQGKELIRNEIDTLLGPGINIHRHPLNGRNFEYFSEDPLLTGLSAAAIAKGISATGAQATVKHYACNSQETARFTVNSVVSERALRLIYLKGFEIAVREGNAQSIMTSYNSLNGHWSASNYDLNTTLLRKEWGYTGIVMTDWWARMNDVVYGGPEDVTYTRDMVRAQNDLYMVVANDGAETNAGGDNTLQSLEEGRLTIGELQRCASNICRFLINTPAFGREIGWKKNKLDAKLYQACKECMEGEEVITGEPNKIHIVLNDKNVAVFKVEQEATYRVISSVMSRESSLAQMVCNIKLNGEELATVQTNGTDGCYVRQQLLQVKLEPGFYKIELEFVKPGMVVQFIDFEEVSFA